MPASSEPEWIHLHATRVLVVVHAALALLFTFLVSPVVGFRDSGELAAASFHMGIAHPTGFPLPMLMGKAATLVPLGDAALRLNVASGLAMAGAITLLVSVVLGTGRTRSWIVPVCAAGVTVSTFVLSPSTMWFGTNVEVYSWSALLGAFSLTCASRAIRERDGRWMLMSLFLTGLAGGCHVSALMASAAATTCAVLALLRSGSHRPPLHRATVHGSLALAVGLLVILYLPLRSIAHPAVMWDDLSGIGPLWDHLSGARIRTAFAGRLGGSSPGLDGLALGRLLASDTGSVAFALGPAAVLLTRGPARSVSWTLMAIVIADLLYSLLVNPMGIEDRQVGWLASLSLATLAGMSVHSLLVRLAATRASMAMALGPVLLAASVLLRPSIHPNPPTDHLPALWSTSQLEQLTPRSVVLCSSDDLCALSMWLQSVQGERPDVSTIPRQHLWNDGSLAQNLGRAHPDLARQVASAGASQSSRLLRAVRRGRAWGLYWEVSDGADLALAFGPGPPPLTMDRRTVAPLARVDRPAADPRILKDQTRRFFGWLVLCGHDPALTDTTDLHFWTRRVFARDLLSTGLILARASRPLSARDAFLLADALNPGYAPALVNAAILEGQMGHLRRAIDLATRAVEADPARRKARLTLARLLREAGREEEARRVLAPLEHAGAEP